MRSRRACCASTAYAEPGGGLPVLATMTAAAWVFASCDESRMAAALSLDPTCGLTGATVQVLLNHVPGSRAHLTSGGFTMHTAEEVLTFLLKYVEKHGDSFESPKAAELSGRLLEDVQPVVRDLQGAIDGVVAPVDPNGLRAAPAVSQSFNFDSDKDAGQQPQVDVHGRASD